jgi:hypothetical protein
MAALAGLLIGPGSMRAQEAATKTAGQDQGGQQITSESRKKTPASTIDFAGELGLGFASLKSLGPRIELARSAPDPVGLAAAAAELGVAERVAERQAALKAADLLKEAIDMARARNRPDELNAVALYAGDDSAKKDLQDRARKAGQAAASRKSGERARGITGRLYVVNNTKWYITIYVNYERVGVVNPYGAATMYVGDSSDDTTILYGDAEGTPLDWGPRRVSQAVRDYTWTLN